VALGDAPLDADAEAEDDAEADAPVDADGAEELAAADGAELDAAADGAAGLGVAPDEHAPNASEAVASRIRPARELRSCIPSPFSAGRASLRDRQRNQQHPSASGEAQPGTRTRTRP
jgi:hypothetical protein